MTEVDDHELLAQYAGTESEAAFATLVARYVKPRPLGALRFTGNGHYARKSPQASSSFWRAKPQSAARHGAVGWLYQAARLTAANFMKGESRANAASRRPTCNPL